MTPMPISIPTIGHVALILSLVTSVVQIIVPLVGAARNSTGWMHAGRRWAAASFFFVLISFLSLMYAHVTDDFSVLNVVEHSHTQKPMLYKISGVWASHEGSMMLWVLILVAFGMGMATMHQSTLPNRLRARAISVQGMVGAAFIGFILFTSSPFARVFPVPLEGNDLNPILQDPGLAFHPPFLYLGYVGFSSVFALAAGFLLSRDIPVTAIRALRPWVMLAWGALTCGIIMGSWWSYYELGWCGYWFWDPVENAALMPWLAGTALLHSLAVSSRRGVLMRWTILLAILTFSLSLLGTFLVRSGILTSVHSFAVDPARGVYVLALLATAVGGALSLYAARAHTLPDGPLFAPVSREGVMLMNNLFLCTACVTLMAGTLYPIILDAFGGGIVSVGAPYFNTTVVPLLVPAFILTVIGPFLRWSHSDLKPVLMRLRLAALGSVVAFLVALCALGKASVPGVLAIVLGAWLAGGALTDLARYRRVVAPHASRLLGHGGLGVLIIGIGGSLFAQQHSLVMQPGTSTDVAGYHIEFERLEHVEFSNYGAARGIFHISHGNTRVTLFPEQRTYNAQGMALSHVAIYSNILCDWYLALGDEQDNGASENKYKGKTRIVRFHTNPLIPLIWIGGVMMAAGGAAGALRRVAPKTGA